jgi:hypothetical protein
LLEKKTAVFVFTAHHSDRVYLQEQASHAAVLFYDRVKYMSGTKAHLERLNAVGVLVEKITELGGFFRGDIDG